MNDIVVNDADLTDVQKGRLSIIQHDDPDLLDKVLYAQKNGLSITVAPPKDFTIPAPSKVHNADGLFNYRGHGASWAEVDRVKEIIKSAIGDDVGNVACTFTIWHLYAIISKMAAVELGNTWVDYPVWRSIPKNFCDENKVNCLLTESNIISGMLDAGAQLSDLKRVIVLDGHYAPTPELASRLGGRPLLMIHNFCGDWRDQKIDKITP